MKEGTTCHPGHKHRLVGKDSGNPENGKVIKETSHSVFSASGGMRSLQGIQREGEVLYVFGGLRGDLFGMALRAS